MQTELFILGCKKGTHFLIQIMCKLWTYPDSEVFWGRVNPAMWGEGAGNVLQTEGSDVDQPRQFDNEKTLGATECPAFTRVYTRLQYKKVVHSYT
jgi:hypothetical protein